VNHQIIKLSNYQIIKLLHSMKKNILFWLIILFTFTFCNKSVVKVDNGNEVIADTVARSKKALLILVDGAQGEEYQAMALPTLKSLEQNSIYSYTGLNSIVNEKMTTDGGLASVMTGVASAKHEVTNDITVNNFAQYPSLVTRLKGISPAFKIVTVAADADVSNYLFSSADEKYVYANDDAAVSGKTVSLLQTTNANVVIAHFNSPNQAGLATSFSESSPDYAQAAANIDNYIKTQIETIKNRPAFAIEDWIVMIASSVGSQQQNTNVPWNAFEDKNHNGLYFFYNPRFQSRSYTKPAAGSLLPYQGLSENYLIGGGTANNRTAYMDSTLDWSDLNFGTAGSYTIWCKIKTTTSGSFNYPSFLGKRATFDAVNAGWLFFFEGNKWGFNVSGGGGSANTQARDNATSNDLGDGKWHTLVATITQNGTNRNLNIYTDGAKYTGASSGSTIANTVNLNSTSPLMAGWRPSSNSSSTRPITITDIRIYNLVLPDVYISSNYCTVSVPPEDPYYNNLLGFWPCLEVLTDNSGKLYFQDYSLKNRRLILNDFISAQFNDTQFGVCPPVSEAMYKLAPMAVDVANQMYSWFGIPVSPLWSLDGKTWVPSYN
jgi:hypothetical protein